jgi:MerR family transcriptional regulator/heat shock protein HspR
MARRPKEPGSPEPQEDRAVYVISVAAELAGVHPQTLRIYERKGLLRPQRTPGNSRRYSASDIARLRLIQRLTQEEGVNLAGVRMIVEMENELERMRQQAERLSAELQRQRRRLVDEVDRLRRGSAPAEIVPLSSVTRLRLTQRGGGHHEGPIPLGPGRK